MPTGTGKTLSLLCFILAYQHKYKDTGKLVYCTRTVQEMNQVMAELKRVVAYRAAHSSLPASSAASSTASTTSTASSSSLSSSCLSTSTVASAPTLAVCLSSRRNMCIHPQVKELDSGFRVDSMCRNMTAGFVRDKKKTDLAASSSSSSSTAAVDRAVERAGLCTFFENFSIWGASGDAALQGVYGIEDIKQLGAERRMCPYFMARHLITIANVVSVSFFSLPFLVSLSHIKSSSPCSSLTTNVCSFFFLLPLHSSPLFSSLLVATTRRWCLTTNICWTPRFLPW